LVFVAVICLISIGAIYWVVRSPFGRVLQATRDDEIGARVLGKNTFAIKAKAMMISAFFAGIAGSLFAHYISFIDPSSFSLSEIILVFTIVIVGGLASLEGSVIATFVILLVPEALRFLSLPSSLLGPLRQIIYSVVLLLILLYRPRGIYGRIDAG
jgi:branched-chain amino acid transport system permease protein